MGLFRIARAFVKALLAPPRPVDVPRPVAPNRVHARADELLARLEDLRATLVEFEEQHRAVSEESAQLVLAARALADEAIADVEQDPPNLEQLTRKAEQVRALADAVRQHSLLGGLGRRPPLPS